MQPKFYCRRYYFYVKKWNRTEKAVRGGVFPKPEISQTYGFYQELEDIHYKYERLESMIGILQMFVAEVVDIAGAPENSLNNALYEIEGEMEKTNARLKCLFAGKGGATA